MKRRHKGKKSNDTPPMLSTPMSYYHDEYVTNVRRKTKQVLKQMETNGEYDKLLPLQRKPHDYYW